MKYSLRCLSSKELIDDNYTLHHTDGALLVTRRRRNWKNEIQYEFVQIKPWKTVSKHDDVLTILQDL